MVFFIRNKLEYQKKQIERIFAVSLGFFFCLIFSWVSIVSVRITDEDWTWWMLMRILCCQAKQILLFVMASNEIILTWRTLFLHSIIGYEFMNSSNINWMLKDFSLFQNLTQLFESLRKAAIAYYPTRTLRESFTSIVVCVSKYITPAHPPSD